MALKSGDETTRRIALNSLHYLADLQLACGIDIGLDKEINSKIKNHTYLPIIAPIFPDIVLVFAKYNRAHLFKDSFLKIFLFDLNNFYTDILARLPELLPLLLNRSKDKELNKDEHDAEVSFKDSIMRRINILWQTRNVAWRKYFILIDIIPKIQSYFPLNVYNNYYLDEFFSTLKNCNNALQKSIMEGIWKLLTYNYYFEKRNDIFKKITCLSDSNSFYDRRQFLLFCNYAVEYFFLATLNKFEVLNKYLQLSKDKVPNIRLGFLNNAMKIWSYTPKNRDDIFIVFMRLKNDPNNEVKNTVEKIIKELKINSERIAKNDEVNLVEDKLKENKEYKLKELEETDKQEKTVIRC